jgi:hypothetical protein
LRSLLRFLHVDGAISNALAEGVPSVAESVRFQIPEGVGGVALGIVFGLLSLTMIRVEKDPASGRLVTIAGLSYVALWTMALAARLGFAYGSTHWFKSDLASFSIQHVPGTTYATAYVVWALLMIVIRTLGVIVRAQQVGATIDFSELGHRRQRNVIGRARLTGRRRAISHRTSR